MMTAAAGGAMVCMGSDAAILSGKTVAFEAAGVCSIKGKSKLALQESEKAKGKGKDAKSSAEDEAADPMGEMVFAGKGAKKSGAKSQKGAEPTSTTLAIHVVELDGKPAEDVAFQIKKPDGGTETGKLDKDGRATAKSSKPGTFTVTFPDLDGADWDGEGAEELDEGKRCEVGRVTATAEDRVPAIARDKGFLNWRTVWNFSGNAELKAKRENPNVLWDGDAVVVPSKLKREATVTGGTAEFVLNRQDERVVHVRPLDFDLQPLEGIRYKAKVGDPDINKGVIPPGGFVTLLVPPKAGRGVLVLLPSDDDDSGLDWDFEIQEEALSSSTEHEAQRLINLSLGSKLPADENKGGDHRLAVVTYQSRIEKPHSEDAAIAGEMVAMHDGGDCPDDGGSEGQA
jgi:N-acetylmuramoyl-L-alanine amidase